MSAADFYHQQAAAERVAAQKEILPQRCQQHERSAERWEEMARSAEETERRTAINEASRQARALS